MERNNLDGSPEEKLNPHGLIVFFWDENKNNSILSLLDKPLILDITRSLIHFTKEDSEAIHKCNTPETLRDTIVCILNRIQTNDKVQTIYQPCALTNPSNK